MMQFELEKEEDQVSPIEFVEEDVTLPSFFEEEKILIWLNELVVHHGSSIVQLTYIFCSDEYLLDINKSYLSHDYYTDIITFPFQQGKKLESDIFISLDRVKDNATLNEVSYQDELLRVMSHGVLHLLGMKDKEEEDVLKMRAEEDKAILSYHKILS